MRWLIGTTPRTVKRYVNTYRLIKARARDPVAFDESADGIAPDEIVAFLLAVVTGHPALAAILLPALAASPPGATLNAVLADMPLDGGTPLVAASRACVRAWLTAHPRDAEAPASRFGEWAIEVRPVLLHPSGPRRLTGFGQSILLTDSGLLWQNYPAYA
jgi:hypothetical protein